MATLGAELADIASGRVAIALPIEPRLSQQDGFLHAGVVVAALDSACGYAALTLMPDEAEVLTVELKVNLLAPASGERLVAEGEVLRAGRTLTVCRGDAHAEQSAGRVHGNDAGDDGAEARRVNGFVATERCVISPSPSVDGAAAVRDSRYVGTSQTSRKPTSAVEAPLRSSVARRRGAARS